MSKQSRRDFLKTTAIATTAITGLASKKTKAEGRGVYLPDKAMGVLVDTTVCIGCRRCEWACKTAHDMPTPPLENYDDRTVYENMRRPDYTSYTVVNEYENDDTGKFPIDVKVQCMHCNQPACVSACIVGAFSKLENGAVVWDESKCIGCRYCMVACPFQIPAFEYQKAIQPRITKCDFCSARQAEGKLPACVEICPVEALTFGKREDLIQVAKEKMRLYPGRYVDHIYGEFEVGGTSWMYLASQDFSKLAFPKLQRDPAPGVSESIQHGLFAYFVPPIALYALLGGVMWLNKNKKSESEEEQL